MPRIGSEKNDMTGNRKRLVVAVTGASGAELGMCILRALRAHQVETHLILSEGAKAVISSETQYCETDFTSLADHCYTDSDIGACIASGSFATDGMIIAPCSMKTLSGIANAYDENLCIRAADVCLKERRKLVLIPREAPLNNAHLRNMLTVSQDGGIIIPPVLSFYSGADTGEKQLAHITGKVLAQFGLHHDGFVPWQGA